MARCVVLGGNGFVGSHLVETLVKQGHETVVFGRQRTVHVPEISSLPGVVWTEGDFCNADETAGALEGCEYLFHLISTTLPKSSNDNPGYDIASNLGSTVAMLDAAVRHGVRKVIFLSSGGTVYGVPQAIPIAEDHPTDPLCSYGITKLAIEKYLHLYNVLHGLEYAVLRLSNPFGPRQRIGAKQGAIAVFLGRALSGQPIEIWGDGSVVRDYVYVDDTVSALVAAMDETGPHRVFNVGSNEGRSLNQILDAIEHQLGQRVDRRYLTGRPFDVPVSVLSVERAREFLRWEPRVSFEAGLKRTIDWIRSSQAS